MSTREKPTVILVAPELVLQGLGAPDGVRVVEAALQVESNGYTCLRLSVECEGWPEGEITPWITEVPRQLVWKHNEIELGRREMRP